MLIGAPDDQRGKARAVFLEPGQHVLDHGVGHLRSARGLGEEDGERFDLVAVIPEIVLEVLCDLPGVLDRVAGTIRRA